MSPFTRGCLSQADDPYQRWVFGIGVAVDDKQDPDATCHRTDTMPTLLAVLKPVEDDGVHRVGEHDLGKREIEAVLGLVPCRGPR